MSDKKVGLIAAGIVTAMFLTVFGGCYRLATHGFVPEAIILTVTAEMPQEEPTEAKTSKPDSTTTTEERIEQSKNRCYCCESKKSLGEFKITVYTPHDDGGRWGYSTATGEQSKHLATCAVDPSVIPLGTVIEVGGYRLLAADTGSAVKGRVIDVFFDGTESEAEAWADAHFDGMAEVYGW